MGGGKGQSKPAGSWQRILGRLEGTGLVRWGIWQPGLGSERSCRGYNIDVDNILASTAVEGDGGDVQSDTDGGDVQSAFDGGGGATMAVCNLTRSQKTASAPQMTLATSIRILGPTHCLKSAL